jgi:hypothetical protein
VSRLAIFGLCQGEGIAVQSVRWSAVVNLAGQPAGTGLHLGGAGGVGRRVGQSAA